MATFEGFPAELKIEILKCSPDICTLVSLVSTCRQITDLYKENALRILSAVVDNSSAPVAKMMRNTFAAHHSNGHVSCVEGTNGLIKWSVPEKSDIWHDKDGVKERALATLKSLAHMIHEVAELTDWVYGHQHDLNLLPVYDARGAPLRHEEVHRIVWLLRQHLARLSNLDICAVVTEAGAHHYGLSPNAYIKHQYLAGLSSGTLRATAQVLNILNSGYGALKRHMLRPSKGTMLHALFAQQAPGSGRNDMLKSDIGYVLRERKYRHGWSSGHADSTKAANEVQDIGAKDQSKYGHLHERDHAAYGRYFEDEEKTKASYMERFRPLLGLSYGSGVVVGELVGKGTLHGHVKCSSDDEKKALRQALVSWAHDNVIRGRRQKLASTTSEAGVTRRRICDEVVV